MVLEGVYNFKASPLLGEGKVFTCKKQGVGCQNCLTQQRQSNRFTPAFSVTCIGDIFVHLSTCYLKGCLTAKRQFFMVLAEEMTNK